MRLHGLVIRWEEEVPQVVSEMGAREREAPWPGSQVGREVPQVVSERGAQ